MAFLLVLTELTPGKGIAHSLGVPLLLLLLKKKLIQNLFNFVGSYVAQASLKFTT